MMAAWLEIRYLRKKASSMRARLSWYWLMANRLTAPTTMKSGRNDFQNQPNTASAGMAASRMPFSYGSMNSPKRESANRPLDAMMTANSQSNHDRRFRSGAGCCWACSMIMTSGLLGKRVERLGVLGKLFFEVYRVFGRRHGQQGVARFDAQPDASFAYKEHEEYAECQQKRT